MKKILSIIVNCFNEEESIKLYYNTTKKVLDENKIDYEFIFIDDNSKDNTLMEIKNLNKVDKNVKYISMSRNFGKEEGIFAGYTKAIGDFIVCMDVDLQDPPELLPKMYNLLCSGEYDAVATTSTSRNGYSFIRKIFTKTYYMLIRKLSDFNMREGIRDYRMVTRKVADSFLMISEHNRYSRYLFEYIGFKTYWLEFDNQERVAGITKWNFRRLFLVAIDAFSSSTKLLNLFFYISFVYLVLFIISLILFILVKQYYLLFITLTCFILLVLNISLSIISLYIKKIYYEVLNRPLYVVKEENE